MLKDLIERADQETGAAGLQTLTYIIDGIGMATTVGELGAEAAALASTSGAWGAAGFAFGTAGVLAQAVSVWLTLGGAHAEAMSAIAKDHILRGISYGVVLGANGAKPNYVRDNFWLNAEPDLPFYREFQKKARDLQNAGLVAGYSEGKKLEAHEMRAFFEDIRGRMGDADRDYFDYTTTPWKDWSPEKKEEFYTTSAAIFRRDHLED